MSLYLPRGILHPQKLQHGRTVKSALITNCLNGLGQNLFFKTKSVEEFSLLESGFKTLLWIATASTLLLQKEWKSCSWFLFSGSERKLTLK